MMNYYINNFSYQHQQVIADTRTLIHDFIDVCERAQTFSFEKLFMPDDFRIREISSGFSFVSFLTNSAHSDNLRIRLQSLLVNQINKVGNDDLDDRIQYIYWNNVDSDFFKRAHNQNVPVVSFRTMSQFDVNSFPIESRILNEDGVEIISNHQLINLSHSNHFVTHAVFLNGKIIAQADLDKNWNALTTPFRFIARINIYLTDIDYYNRIAVRSDEHFKMSLFFDTGVAIAEMNGWKLDRRVSSRNSTPNKKRKVFVARNPTAYLSIDFMHGTFELHNRFGVHITEYNFRGVNLNSTYTDRSHDIIT